MTHAYTKRQAFTHEFLLHAKTTKGWPAEASVKSWCGENGRQLEFMQNGMYARVARGEFVDDRHVWLVTCYLLHPAHKDHPERRSLNQFLLNRGVESPHSATAEQVIDLVSVKEEIPDDGFGWGTRVILSVFDSIARPTSHVRLIRAEHEVREAMGWLWVEAGRQLTSLKLPQFQALAAQEARVGVSLQEYQERAVAWWKTNPWTVVYAIREKKITGVCIALPVTEEFYKRARSGECATFDCQQGDLEVSSPFIIVEGVVPEIDMRTKTGGLGESLVMAAVCQQARLSDVQHICLDKPLRLLSFTATPVGKRRLRKFGYKPLGTYFPGKDIEYMERQLVLSPLRPADAALVGVWKCLQLTLREN